MTCSVKNEGVPCQSAPTREIHVINPRTGEHEAWVICETHASEVRGLRDKQGLPLNHYYTDIQSKELH